MQSNLYWIALILVQFDVSFSNNYLQFTSLTLDCERMSDIHKKTYKDMGRTCKSHSEKNRSLLMDMNMEAAITYWLKN